MNILVSDLISERHIVVFAPHYDDCLFMLGGYVHELKKQGLVNTKSFHILILFSRSNYLAGTGNENHDNSNKRIQLASGIRLIEDMNCLDELLGAHQYRYELAGERECFVRGKSEADSEMEFPHGMWDDFNDEDFHIFHRMVDRIHRWALKEDTALVFPLAFKEHIDHFIVREAAIQVASELGNCAKAKFYFHEDKPYGGIASEAELERTENFISAHDLQSRIYQWEPEAMIQLAFNYYVSQVQEIYKTGIRNRASHLANRLSVEFPCDRICVYNAPGTAKVE